MMVIVGYIWVYTIGVELVDETGLWVKNLSTSLHKHYICTHPIEFTIFNFGEEE